MTPFLTYVDPQPGPAELPPRLPSPFDAGPPHPLAQRAAAHLQASLRRGDDFPAQEFEGFQRGKMFGVLVVADQAGRVGYLKGFSGMVEDSWKVEGFAGPLFDLTARDAFWPSGQAELAAMSAEIATLQGPSARRDELRKRQVARSCELLEQIFLGYQLVNARQETRSLRDIFAPRSPPGGAADCAAPKLFGHARQHGLRPIALGEFWWGTPPSGGGRHPGQYYPACRGKCGPVLGHMLQGWDVEPPPVFGGGAMAAHEPRTVYEDEWIVVVDKPVGLLSVPGRGGHLLDSVRTRLRQRYPHAHGELLVHRLDLDTSGLLLAAKDPRTHVTLQKQFLAREVEKRYIAWLDGSVIGEQGTISLPIRVDLDDRPRQIHDPLHGKPAITTWRVLARDGARTRVALFPHTGRTHQLRVHAAHPHGLAAPIVGDRLYGQAAGRLLLHAEGLGFTHPHSGARLVLVSPAPF